MVAVFITFLDYEKHVDYYSIETRFHSVVAHNGT